MARTPDGRLLVWAIVASHFGPPFMFSGVAVALPAMGSDLAAGATALGLVETLFLAGSVAFLLPAGRLADAGDKRTLYELGLSVFALSSAAIGLLSSLPAILALRFVQGIASAVFAATGPAILADLVPAERRGRVYGSSIGAIYAGLTLGPIAAGALIEAWTWRAVFFAGAAAIGLLYVLVRTLLRSSWRRPPAGAVHRPSALLVIAAVLALVVASATLRHGAAGYAWIAVGLALAAAFVRLQRRLARPLLDVDALLRNHVLCRALSVQMLVYTNAVSSVFLLSLFLQSSLGQPARTAGQVLATGSVAMAVLAPVAGSLADRVSPAVLSGSGVACVLLSTLLAGTLAPGASPAFVAGILAVQGTGFALFSSPNTTVIMGSVPGDSVGIAAALGAKARALGMVTGMMVATVLISLSLGDEGVDSHPDRVAGTAATTFRVLAGITAVALLTSLGPRTRE